ncbi:multiprotein-bridging factor 1 family protein [Thioclava sp. GXIMD4215]|uniref:helix-turn-helix domain-containing protein n=1 Tax=Thioclava sp. GXIMD4215 TaxID=3131928 RepID=UPI00324941B7
MAVIRCLIVQFRLHCIQTTHMNTLSTVLDTMITPEQCRMARAALRLGVRELAEISGVSAMTISRFENEQSGGQAETLRKLEVALRAAGVEFLPANGGGPGVRLK